MPSVSIWVALLGLSVNILSSYHPKEAIVSASENKVRLEAKGQYLYVNGKTKDRYSSASDSFTISWGERSRGYAGSLAAWADKGELVLVNKVDEDSYLSSVVGAEMVGGARLEAFKAQAVLSRTFLYSAQRHKGEPWVLCDLTHCQSYKGLESTNSLTKRAVEETEGLVLTYEGRPCRVYYHSTCGGRTADARSVWPYEDSPYLCSVTCGYCTASPHYEWKTSLDANSIARALKMPQISDVEITKLSPDQRVQEVRVKGTSSFVYAGWQFRMLVSQSLGWNSIPSSWFAVRKDGESFIFTGHGLGHGVGLCQWGAKGMAEQGKGFKAILGHYFPATEVSAWR